MDFIDVRHAIAHLFATALMGLSFLVTALAVLCYCVMALSIYSFYTAPYAAAWGLPRLPI